MTLQYDGVRPVVEGTLEGDTWTTTAVNYWEGPTYYSPLASRYLPNGGGGYNYLADGLGSTRQLMRNSDHAITDTYAYDAFGNTLASSGGTDNPYRYAGQWGAGTLSLQQIGLGVRAYQPQFGRLMSRDPLPHQHAYAYCHANPTRFVDPDGAFPWIVIGGVIGVGGVAGKCIDNALGKATGYLNVGRDTMAHCFAACKITRCLGAGLVQAGVIVAIMDIREYFGNRDPDDYAAERLGGGCGAAIWELHCDSCCRKQLCNHGVRLHVNDPQ